MRDPNLSDVCPYCFSSVTSTEGRLRIWPPFTLGVTCLHCGKRFGRDRYGRTIKFELFLVSYVGFAIAIGIVIYLLVK